MEYEHRPPRKTGEAFVKPASVEHRGLLMQECEIFIGKGLKLAGTRSSVIAPGFSPDTAYVKGQLVMREGDLYAALRDLAPGPWNDGDWLLTSLSSRIPAKTSDLQNDSEFTTKQYVDKVVGDIDTLLSEI